MGPDSEEWVVWDERRGCPAYDVGRSRDRGRRHPEDVPPCVRVRTRKKVLSDDTCVTKTKTESDKEHNLPIFKRTRNPDVHRATNRVRRRVIYGRGKIRVTLFWKSSRPSLDKKTWPVSPNSDYSRVIWGYFSCCRSKCTTHVCT